MTIAPAQLEQHRTALTGHCYRMMGSAVDADDAVQETMVRAWRSLDRFDGRSSLRTWLYRIATNVCLDLLAQRARRARPTESGSAGTVDDPLTTMPRTHWLEPVPDAHALPADADPYELIILRQSIHLAFVAALQHLPPKQRAALLLAEVLGWSAAEIAESLDTSVASVNSALQRARATLGSRDVANAGEPLSEAQSKLVQRYVDAFLRYDVDELVALLYQDASAVHASLYALAARAGRDPQVASRAGIGFHRGPGLRLTVLRPVSAQPIRGRLPAMGPHRSRAVRRPHHGLELVPGYVDAVSDVRTRCSSPSLSSRASPDASCAIPPDIGKVCSRSLAAAGRKWMSC